jgi:cobalt-precorrin 5A hydrolase
MVIEPLNKKIPDKLAIWCITPKGKALGIKLKNALPDAALFISNSIDEGSEHGIDIFGFDTLGLEIQKTFNQYSGHMFIFSTGIAVRLIAPLLKSKIVDPAVVVIDDNGNHAISLISGHIGGANALTRKIADIIHARSVITTATDINSLPAIDLIAIEKGLYIETPWNIKRINMAFLTGKPIDLYDPFDFIKKELREIYPSKEVTYEQGIEKIFCSPEIRPVPRETMTLRPRILSVGIGCNRGTRVEEIYDFLTHVFKEGNLSLHSVDRLSSIDLKENEKGLLTLAEKMKLPLDFHTAEKLNSVDSIQTPSKMVEKHVGVKSVCEASAILSAGNGNLIITKKKNKDVTIAVAIRK